MHGYTTHKLIYRTHAHSSPVKPFLRFTDRYIMTLKGLDGWMDDWMVDGLMDWRMKRVGGGGGR